MQDLSLARKLLQRSLEEQQIGSACCYALAVSKLIGPACKHAIANHELLSAAATHRAATAMVNILSLWLKENNVANYQEVTDTITTRFSDTTKETS